VQQSGFTRARSSHDRHQFACFDIERNPAQHFKLRALGGAEGFA
jgi:hypothetical protein